MTYNEAVEYINSFVNYERAVSWNYPDAVKLDRMRALAKELGNPQNRFESVIIAGSKGKGSTAAILSSILRMEDIRVGLYTSPHLVDIRERIQVNGLWISEHRFIEITQCLRRILDTAAWRRDPPTFFELLTGMAFTHFEQMKVQVAVLEVGLGGLYDSTNIVPAKVVGLTPISLEHTDKLGKTLAKIAVQKCGVIKGRETVISAAQEEEAASVIQKAAFDRQARLVCVGKDIKILERNFSPEGQSFDLRTPFGNFFNLEISLLGEHQMENAALAVGLAKSLEERTRLKIQESAIRQGIRDARWPGRMEKIADNPIVLLDGAQNPASAKILMRGVERHFVSQKIVLVLGVSQDKDLEGMLEALLPSVSSVVATQSSNPRALSAERIAVSVKNHQKEVWVEKNPKEALERAQGLAGADGLVLATGSLFLVGELKV